MEITESSVVYKKYRDGKLRMKITVYATLSLVAVVGVLACPTVACADHILLQDGRLLFNVTLVDQQTSSARPLNVLLKDNSYLYDYDTKVLSRVKGHFGKYEVADVISTDEELADKWAARKFMEKHQWQRFIPPPPAQIIVPTPEPSPAPTPQPTLAYTEDEIASRTLPLPERVKTQYSLFTMQQSLLANELEFHIRMKTIDIKRGKEERLQLLRRQLRILNEQYPMDDDDVNKAREALKHQMEVVTQKGHFFFEE